MRTILAFLLCLPLTAADWSPKQDKRDHFFGGMLIGATATVVIRWGGVQSKPSARIGFAIGTAAGFGKEYQDWRANKDAARLGLPAPHSVEAADAAYTIAGAALGSWLAYELVKELPYHPF